MYTLKTQSRLSTDTAGDLPWFMFADFENSAEFQQAKGLLRDQLRRFMTDGFLVIEKSISSDICEQVLAEFRAFTARNADYFDKFRDPNGYLHRVVNLHLALPYLLELFVTNEQALAFQDALFGAETTVYTSLYFERGSSQDIHRDTPYFCTRPEYLYVGMWVALEDADEGNGCLQVIRGGHLLPELDRPSLATEAFGSVENVPAVPNELFNSYQNLVVQQCREIGLKVENVPIKRGDTLIWHPQLPHGGSPIADGSRTRNSIVMHTVPRDTPVYQADAFFNPKRARPVSLAWDYGEYGGRLFARHAAVEVMHQEPRDPASFS